MSWNNICFKTNPKADWPLRWAKNFEINLRKNNWYWWSSDMWTRIIDMRNWTQTVRWDNVWPWSFRLNFWKENDSIYFSDSSALLYNCD